MGDVCETLSILHLPSGDDYNMLNANERKSGDLSRFAYTDQEKMILCQCKGYAAEVFFLFTQDRKETWLYVLFETMRVISTLCKDLFSIVPGMLILCLCVGTFPSFTISNTFLSCKFLIHFSHEQGADLCVRGEKTVLVKLENTVVDKRDFTNVVQMDPLIEIYRNVYANDL